MADANGESMESDVIAAADWVLANKDTYGIKVVNISMAGTSPTSFQFDPLDQAVERLWLSGVTVVVAAGNFGTGSAVDMSAAPGNDPFVITVGALDQNQHVRSVRRHGCSVVGVRLHGRRLLEARHRGSGSLHGHAGADGRHDPADGA